MYKIGIGVNEYVILSINKGSDYSLQSHGLSGCVLVIIIDSLFCYYAHVSRIAPGEPFHDEQIKGLRDSIDGAQLHNPTVYIIGQKNPFGWTPNIKRLDSLAKSIFPTAKRYVIEDKGAYVSLSDMHWKVFGCEGADFSGNINTIDAAKVGIECATLLPESQVCRASSIHGSPVL